VAFIVLLGTRCFMARAYEMDRASCIMIVITEAIGQGKGLTGSPTIDIVGSDWIRGVGVGRGL